MNIEDKQKAMLADDLTAYINQKHNQDKCTGFIDGYNSALSKVKNLGLFSVVPSTLSDEEATKMLVNCPYEKRGFCNAEYYKCRFKIDYCGNGGDGCELAL